MRPDIKEQPKKAGTITEVLEQIKREVWAWGGTVKTEKIYEVPGPSTREPKIREIELVVNFRVP